MGAVSEADLKPSNNSVISHVLLQISIQPTLDVRPSSLTIGPACLHMGIWDMGKWICGLVCRCHESLDFPCNRII